MSGTGFRGRGSVPRGRNLRGMGLVPGGDPGMSGVRNSQLNFNQPRRESHGSSQDFWLEHPGSAPWQQTEFHHPHSQYPYDAYRYHRGRPQYLSGIGTRGRSKRIRGDGRHRGFYQLGGYQMRIARPLQPQPQPEMAKFAPLGSEEERQQKIAETADKLKQKLSSLTVEEPVNFWDDNLVGVAFTTDDQEQHLVSNRGIPELRHDPPELNLTVSDFKDIGRVDPDCFGNATEPQDFSVVEKVRENRNHNGNDAGSLGSEIYLNENNNGLGNETKITEQPNKTEPERCRSDQVNSPRPVAEQLKYTANYEKKVSTPEPRVEPVDAAEEASRPEEKETNSNRNPELSESLEKLRKVIKIDRELAKEGKAILLTDNRSVFKPSLDFRPEINHGYPRIPDCGNAGESREPRREQSRFKEQFWPDYPRDMPQGKFGPDFNRYDSGPGNFGPQGPLINYSEFGQGPPRINRNSGNPIIDRCDMEYDPRGPPPRFNNFRQEQPRNNSWFDRNHISHSVNGLQPPPAFDPRGPPPSRFMNQEPGPIYVPNADYAPVLPMGYGRQIPHMHVGPRPYVPIINGSFNPIMPVPNTAPCIIQDFLPRIPDKIDSQVTLQPPPPPPPIVGLDEINLPDVDGGAQKLATSGPNPTPNMNEELEDMQEALEFAKTIMNMTEEETDLIQSLHMPTFPDLPPIPSTEPSHLVDQAEAEVGETVMEGDYEATRRDEVALRAEVVRRDEATKNDEALEIVTEPGDQILDDQTRTKVVFNVNCMNKKLAHPEHWPKQNDDSATKIKKIREKLANPTLPVLKENKGSKPPCEEKRERRKKPEEVSVPQEIPTPDNHVTKSPSSSSKASKSLLVSTVDANWKDKVINQFLKMSKNDICNMVNSSGLRKFDIAMKHLVKERKYSLSQERRTSADDAVKGGTTDMSREEFMSQLSAMLDPSATVDVKNLPAKFIQHLSEVLKLDVESHLNEAENIPQENDGFDNGDNHFVMDNEHQNFTQFLPVEDIPEINNETGINSGLEMEISTDFSNRFTTPESLNEPVPNMEVLDDIFSAGIARAKLGLNPKFPEVQAPAEIDLEPDPQTYIRAKCTKTLMMSQAEENVNLDEIFSAGIARAKEGKVRNSEKHSPEAWGRKKRQNADLFRNLTKEEWEARCGNSCDRELAQSRASTSRETSLGTRSRSPKLQAPKNHRLNRNRSPPTPAVSKNSVEPIRDTRIESCSDFGSSLSSDGDHLALPNVSKLLKVIKEREKIGKDLTLTETIRGEVTAEMEKDRERERETEAKRKLRKREKCLKRRDRKDRLETKSRDEESPVEIELEDPISIKQSELIIDHEPFSETANTQKILSTKSADKNGETSLAAILYQENNDYGNLKSREMLVAREYAGRIEAQEVAQNMALQNKSPVRKSTQNHSSEKLEGKRPQIFSVEKTASKFIPKTIPGRPETEEVQWNLTSEAIRNQSPVQKLKETKEADTEVTSTKSGAKRIGIKMQEIRENLTPERIQTSAHTHRSEKLEIKEVKVGETEVPANTSGTKKIDITLYKARKLQRNFGQKEKPEVVVETGTELPASIQTPEKQTKKTKVAEDLKPSSAGRKCTDINSTENSEPGTKMETQKRSRALQVIKPGVKEEKKLGKGTLSKEDKKSDKPKVTNDERVGKRKSRETERSKSREGIRRSSREKSNRTSQESSHSVKRQDKVEAKNKSQNNNVVESRDRKATKQHKDDDSAKGIDEKIDKRQTRDATKKYAGKPKDNESRAKSVSTESAKNNNATEVERREEVSKKLIDAVEPEEVEKEKDAEKTEVKNMEEIQEEKEAEKTEEVKKQTEVENIEEIPEEKEAEKAEEFDKQTEIEHIGEVPEEKETEYAEEVKQTEVENMEEIKEEKEAEETEEVPKQTDVKNMQEIMEEKAADETEGVPKNGKLKVTEQVPNLDGGKTTEEVTGMKEVQETPKEMEDVVQRQEEAKDTEDQVEIPKCVEEEAQVLVRNKDLNIRKGTEELNFEEKKTEETVQVLVQQSPDEIESNKPVETEAVLASWEENTVEVATESTIPEAEPELENLEKDPDVKRDEDNMENSSLIDKDTLNLQILDDDLRINDNDDEDSSTVFQCSDEEVQILLNDLIGKAISQLGLLNANKNQGDEKAKKPEKLMEENKELEEALDISEERGEAVPLVSEEIATEKPEHEFALGGNKKPRDIQIEPDVGSPRTPESPLIGFSEESINCSILGKRKLDQSVLEITEDFVCHKRPKNFDDIMLDMIAESASIPDEVKEQISQDRDIEGEAKIKEEIHKLIPVDLGAGYLTPSGDTLSLGSSIDFDQGEFIVLSEISSDENFSQDKNLRPVVEEPKLEENKREMETETEKPDKIDIENTEVAFTICQEENTQGKHREDCLNLDETDDRIEPLKTEPLVCGMVETPVVEELERKTSEVESGEPSKPETPKKDSVKAVLPSSERSVTRNLHRAKHKHKTKHKKDKKYKISEKKVKEVVRDEDIVTLVKKQQTKEVVMARMIEIDIEIHKLMSEKLKLYHMLESGELPTEQNPPVVKEKSETISTLPSKHESATPTSSKTGSSESQKESREKDSTLAKRSSKPQRHSETRKTTSEKSSDGRTSVSKKKQREMEEKSASKRSSPSQRKEDSVRKSNSLKEIPVIDKVEHPEIFPKSKKAEHQSAQRKNRSKEDSVRKIAKKEEAESLSGPVNNVLQAQQIYSDESSQVSVSSQQETAKTTGNKKGLKGLALLEESYEREKAILKKRRSNLSRASKKDEPKPTSKTGGGDLLSSEEDMPLDLLYVKKFRKKPQKNTEIKRTKSTDVIDHVLEVINAVAENKIEQYQQPIKIKSEIGERRRKVSKSKADLEETQATWHFVEERKPNENVVCEDERLGEMENPDNWECAYCPGEKEPKSVVEEKCRSKDMNRSDLTESLNQMNYDDIPEIDEAFVKIEINKSTNVFHPMVEIHNCDPDVLSVASSSGLKRDKRRRRHNGDHGRATKRFDTGKSEIKSCCVRLVDCKYTYLRSFNEAKTPPLLLEDEMLPMTREQVLTSKSDLRNSEVYDEDDLEIMRIHAMSLPMEEDEVVQNFCSLEPESLRTLDETEVDQELMQLDSGGGETCYELPPTEISLFEGPPVIEQSVSEVVELEVSPETNEPDSHTLPDGFKIVAKSLSTDADTDDVQEVELPKVQYSVHKGPILDVKVFGDSILAASEDGMIYRYSQTCNGILNTYEGHRGAVTCIYVLPSVLSSGVTRDLLFSGSLDGSLRCYDITTSVQVRNAADVRSSIQCMDQSWGMIYLGTKSGYVFRFHIKSHAFKGDEIKFSEESVLALKATTEGPRRVLIVASRSQPITIRDARDGLFLRTVSGHKTHTVYSLMMDSNLVYCGTSSTAIPVFDFINGTQIQTYNAGPGVVCMRMYKWLLFAGCYDGNIYVFDTQEQRLVCSIPGPGNMLLSMDIVENKIVAGSKDRRLHMWRMPDQVLSLLSKRNNVA